MAIVIFIYMNCFAINIVSKGTLGLLERCVGGWASVGYKFKYNRHLRNILWDRRCKKMDLIIGKVH